MTESVDHEVNENMIAWGFVKIASRSDAEHH